MIQELREITPGSRKSTRSTGRAAEIRRRLSNAELGCLPFQSAGCNNLLNGKVHRAGLPVRVKLCRTGDSRARSSSRPIAVMPRLREHFRVVPIAV